MSTTTQNRLESRLGGVTIEGEPHSLSAWFVVGLRVMMGWVFLTAGLGKFAFVSGESFNAAGYLANVDPASPVAGTYAAMAAMPELMAIVNVTVPVTQVLIGIALIAGAFVRLAALGGAMQMAMFYLGGYEGGGMLAAIDSNFVYMMLFLAIGAFAAGRILGLDRYIENVRVGGERLIERYPKARYLLG